MQNRPLLHDSNNSKYFKTVVLEKMHLKPCDDNDNDNDVFVHVFTIMIQRDN